MTTRSICYSVPVYYPEEVSSSPSRSSTLTSLTWTLIIPLFFTEIAHYSPKGLCMRSCKAKKHWCLMLRRNINTISCMDGCIMHFQQSGNATSGHHWFPMDMLFAAENVKSINSVRSCCCLHACVRICPFLIPWQKPIGTPFSSLQFDAIPNRCNVLRYFPTVRDPYRWAWCLMQCSIPEEWSLLFHPISIDYWLLQRLGSFPGKN